MDVDKIVAAILTLAASNTSEDSKQVLEKYQNFVKALSRRNEGAQSGSGKEYRIIDMPPEGTK